MEAQLLNVNLNEIEVGETNKMFRDPNDFTPAALQELTDSIMKAGVITPILLRPNPKKDLKARKYELVAGERRYRASLAVMVALKDRNTIPANIRTLTDEEALEAQVIENLQRENVNPMKEAVAFDWMTMTKKMTTKQIADRIGKSIDYVQERIRLTTLHKDAQEHVRNGVLPLKAALKLASVPKELQEDVLEECIIAVEGVKGKTYTFRGLDVLQDWLTDHLFLDLANADFNLNDTDLVASAGSCTACTKRTRNSGGLFDDVAKKDCCFDAACFRKKQLTQYKSLYETAKLEAKGCAVFFLTRGYNFNAELEKELGKIEKVVKQYGNAGSSLKEITKAQFDNKNKDLGNLEKLKIAVLVGTGYNPELTKVKYIYYEVAKTVHAASSSGSASSKEDSKKAKEKLEQQEKQNFLEKAYRAEAVIKKFSDKKVSEEYLQQAVRYLLSNEYGDNDDAVYAFKALGLGWEFEKWDNGSKKKIKVTGQEENMHRLLEEYGGIDDDAINEVVSKVKGDKLNALLVYSVLSASTYKDEDLLLKKMKIDTKAIVNKAKTDTAAWWKALKADPVVKAVEAKAGKGVPAKATSKKSGKGLKALLKK